MKMFYFFGREGKYPSLSWWENYLGGHIILRFPFKNRITFFGENAMHWGVTIYLNRFKTNVCFRLPFRCFGHWWPLYFYISPNGTPNSATFTLNRKENDYQYKW